MKKHTRREFLEKAIVGAGAGVALAALGSGSSLEGMQIPGTARAFVSGRYGIELDGIMAGWVESAEGGRASGGVVNENEKVAVEKHLAGVKYEDIVVNCGTGMSRAFYDWIKSAFDRQHVRKNGAISVCDYNYKELSRMEFTGGLITEVGLPALDAASKDAAKMTIKITPEYTRFIKSAGKAVGGPGLRAAQKKWLPANFRLSISGLDCRRVNKIEAITVKQKVVENPTGEIRSYQKEPAGVQAPNLVITLPEADVAGWEAWRKESAEKMARATGKTGQLEYLTPDLRETLFTLSFRNLGIFKLTPDKVEAGSENIRRVKAEMYCEEMKFDYGSGTWA